MLCASVCCVSWAQGMVSCVSTVVTEILQDESEE